MGETDALLKEGIAAIKAGHRAKARAVLPEVVRRRPNDLAAWLWMSSAVDADEERRECLEKVLSIDPANPHAKEGLLRLGTPAAPT